MDETDPHINPLAELKKLDDYFFSPLCIYGVTYFELFIINPCSSLDHFLFLLKKRPVFPGLEY